MTSAHCVLLTSEFPPHALGGIGRYVAEVTPLLRATMRVTVALVPTYHTAAKPLGTPAHGLHACGTGFRDALLGVASIASTAILDAAADHVAERFLDESGARDASVLYVQDYALAPVAAALKRRLRCPVVAACHLPVYAGFTYFDKPFSDALHQVLEARLIGLSRAVVVPSRFTAQVLGLTHNVGDKVTTLPLGASRPMPITEPPDGPPRLLAIGRPTEQKGAHFLLQALAALTARHPDLRATWICGTDSHARLDELVRCSGSAVSDRIDVLGAVAPDDVWHAIDRHQLLVSTSVYETFGLSVLEAMASGRPALGFAIPALQELWGPALSTSMGTPPARVGPLVERIASLLDDHGRCASLGRQARERAASFSWARHVAALSRVLGTPEAGR